MNTLNSWRNEDDEVNWIPYSYQPNSGKSTNQSEAQRSFRSKFGLANSILHLIRPVIKTSFVKYNKGRRSGYNTAVGLFLSNAVRGIYPNIEVNFSAMEVSKGSLPGLDQWEFSINDQEISLTWNKGINKTHAYGDDSVLLLLFNISKKSFTIVNDLAKRADEIINYTIPPSENGDYVAWAYVANRNETNSSNSHFLGRFRMGI